MKPLRPLHVNVTLNVNDNMWKFIFQQIDVDLNQHISESTFSYTDMKGIKRCTSFSGSRFKQKSYVENTAKYNTCTQYFFTATMDDS